MRKEISLLFSAILVCACSGPMGPIPGGELEGTPAPWPQDWTFTDDVDNVLLQTRPEDPYSVTVWMVTESNQPYIASTSDESRWVRYMRDNPHVVLSVEGRLFNATSRGVVNRDEINRVIKAYLVKYEIESEEDFVQEGGVLFRLHQR